MGYRREWRMRKEREEGQAKRARRQFESIIHHRYFFLVRNTGMGYCSFGCVPFPSQAIHGKDQASWRWLAHTHKSQKSEIRNGQGKGRSDVTARHHHPVSKKNIPSPALPRHEHGSWGAERVACPLGSSLFWPHGGSGAAYCRQSA